jgi:hypothetical protein
MYSHATAVMTEDNANIWTMQFSAEKEQVSKNLSPLVDSFPWTL